MSKPTLTVFVCTSKDCERAWRHVCDGSPRKWIKKRVEAAGLACKLRVVKTDCMDRCEDAANVCLVHGDRAQLLSEIERAGDEDRLLAGVRAVLGADRADSLASRGREPHEEIAAPSGLPAPPGAHAR
jgi:hypothetical protein